MWFAETGRRTSANERLARKQPASRHHAAAPGHTGQSVPTTHTRLRQALLLKQLGQEAARGRCLRGDFVLTPHTHTC